MGETRGEQPTRACSKCGKVRPTEERFCIHCGEDKLGGNWSDSRSETAVFAAVKPADLTEDVKEDRLDDVVFG